MSWAYHTMMYADCYRIQFRQDTVSGEIQMRVDDAMAKANGYTDLAELMNEVLKQYPDMMIPQWIRVDDWNLLLYKPHNLN